MKNILLRTLVILLVLSSGWFGYAAYRARTNLVTLNVRDMEVRRVVKKIEWQTWENIFVHKEVEGKVTLNVRKVPLEEVLNIIDEQVSSRWSAIYPLYSSGKSLAAFKQSLRGEIDPATHGWTNLQSRAFRGPGGRGPGGPGDGSRGPGEGARGPGDGGRGPGDGGRGPGDGGRGPGDGGRGPGDGGRGPGDGGRGPGEGAFAGGRGPGGPGGDRGGFGGFGGFGGGRGFGDVVRSQNQLVSLQIYDKDVSFATLALGRYAQARVVPEDGTTATVTLHLHQAPVSAAVAQLAKKARRSWKKVYALRSERGRGGPGEFAARDPNDGERRRGGWENLTPEQREDMRKEREELAEELKAALPPEERAKLEETRQQFEQMRQEMQNMTPEQRRERFQQMGGAGRDQRQLSRIKNTTPEQRVDRYRQMEQRRQRRQQQPAR